MQKKLLIGVALSLTLCGLAQTVIVKPQPSGKINMAEKIALKFRAEPIESGLSAKPAQQGNTALIGPVEQTQEASVTNPPSSINWKLLCGSSNVYGQLVSHSRPLQYNPNVNAVSFIHRKSETYTATPMAPSSVTSGVIVAEISTNWGTTWDSTAIWNDNTNAGRYPQGAIYSAAGNTAIANAYVVGSGPAIAGSNFTGDWYASKKLAAAGSTLYNTTADAAPNAQQFLSFSLPSYPANQCKHGWSRYGFSSTNDGVVRSLALVENDPSDLITMRGTAVIKGTYSGGIFNWTSDTLIPACVVSTGTKVLSSDAQMAWNQSGTIGYVLMIGAASTATGANKGYQPIIYKTTNSGGSWAQIPGIDFNAVAMNPITKNLAPVSTSPTLSIPYFNQYDIAVDANGKLHIGALLASTSSSHNDSLAFISEYTMSINVGDKYVWPHVPGFQPYLFDFIGDGTAAWNVKLIDSLSTEDPGADPTQTGYAVNPWDIDANAKINIDPRLQLGRTPDGQYITFSWSESDTNFVNAGHKWNVLPDIKARCMAIGTGTPNTYLISSTEINVSKPAVGTGTINPKVSSKAFLHYMSSVTGTQSISGTTVDINTPFTVTNSSPLGQLTNNTNWYSNSKLSFSNFTLPGNINVGVFTDVAKTELSVTRKSILYPNPAKNSSGLYIELKNNSDVTINVYSIVGELLKTIKTNGVVGENNIAIDLTNLSSGIYMVNVIVGSEMSTKKLVIE